MRRHVPNLRTRVPSLHCLYPVLQFHELPLIAAPGTLTHVKVTVGFKDRIRIYSLLMEGLRVLRDIPQKNCRAVAYSNGGHLLAVASGFSLFVYTAITAQQVG